MTTSYFIKRRPVESRVLDLRSCSGHPGLPVGLEDGMKEGAADGWIIELADGVEDGVEEASVEGLGVVEGGVDGREVLFGIVEVMSGKIG
mmetsp:Transcript_41126/g.86257  ORF Transcript_41126/g.86257 Transcript_41126/m.86257 type:complete len:90 (-) Transcript_41126:172-441(-)